MTQPEFDRWWSDLVLRFPSVEAWLVKVTAQGALEDHQHHGVQRAMLRTWLAVLGDVAASDALEVNRLMQAGDLPSVGDFDRDQEKIPQHVRRLAKQLAWDRSGGHGRFRDDEQLRPDRSSFPAGKILRRMQELERLGTPHDEARRIALDEFPVGESRREPRYRCSVCLDVGRVIVASNAAIEAMAAGEFDRCHHRDAAMLCSCRPESEMVRKFNGREFRIERFNPALDFKIADYCWGPAEVRRFTDWVEVQREKRAEALLKSKANYEPAFDRWNSQAAQQEAF